MSLQNQDAWFSTAGCCKTLVDNAQYRPLRGPAWFAGPKQTGGTRWQVPSQRTVQRARACGDHI